MASVTTVNRADLEFGNRFDAELYRPSLRDSFVLMQQTKLPMMQLGDICLIRSGTTPQDRISGLKSGPVLFKTTDIRNCVLSSDASYFHISETIHKRMVRTRVQDKDVLLNIVGATLDVIGRTAFVVDFKSEANITQAMVLLRCQNELVLPGYLFAFLNTRFGQDQIARYARPTGQYNLNNSEVAHLSIPLLRIKDQLEIEQCLLTASAKQDEATKLYHQAVDRLSKAIYVRKFENYQPVVGYCSTLAKVLSSWRFDAEHFYPAFDAFRRNLPRDVQLEPLSHFLSYCQRGIQPCYSSVGIRVVNSKHVHANQVILNGNRLAKECDDHNQQIRYGDLLMNGTGRGTLGRAAAYLDPEVAVPDNHVTILRVNDLDPVFLAMYLNTLAGQLQVEIHQRGSSGQLELYPNDMKKFLIWNAPKSFQQEIRDLYERSASAASESQRFLIHAKSRVEQIIEKAVKL